MVRTKMNFHQAVTDLGIKMEPDEAHRTANRREFQDILRVERNKHYQSVANDASRSKSTAIGKMELLIDQLTADGEYEKAGALIEKLAKLEGWIGGDSNVNVFGGLTARDIAEAKERILGKGAGSRGVNVETRASTNPSAPKDHNLPN